MKFYGPTQHFTLAVAKSNKSYNLGNKEHIMDRKSVLLRLKLNIKSQN